MSKRARKPAGGSAQPSPTDVTNSLRDGPVVEMPRPRDRMRSTQQARRPSVKSSPIPPTESVGSANPLNRIRFSTTT